MKFFGYLRDFKKMFANYILVWNHNLKEVDERRLFFKNPDNKHLTKIVPKISFWFTIFPLIFVMIYGFRGLMYLVFRLQKIKMGALTDFVMLAGANYDYAIAVNVQLCYFCWSSNYVFIAVKEFKKNLAKMTFLAVFTVKPGGAIQPIDLSKRID